MLLKRAIAAAAATLLVAGIATVTTLPAAAASTSRVQVLADDARAAATAADQAFIAGDWDEAAAQADVFDAAYGELLAARDEWPAHVEEVSQYRNSAASRVEDAQQAIEDAGIAVADAEAARDAAVAAYNATLDPSLEQAVADTEAALEAARTAADEADQALADAESYLAMYANAVIEYQATLDEIVAVIPGLADAAQSVADRRADLADVAAIKHVVVWTLGADNENPSEGDTVKLTFSIPNSALFALTDAKVSVVTPHGVTPDCDIEGGVVAASAVVTCTAKYVPTRADADAGRVVFKVKLTGYVPLGPGNPRATAATQTLITVNESITVPVAAGAAAEVDDEGDDELAETGLDSAALGALAMAMIVAGGALLVVRRRFADSAL